MTEELKKAKKQRAAARGNVTKARNVLETLLSDLEADKLDIEEAIQELTKYIDSAEQTQSQVELLIEEGELEASQDEAWGLLEKPKATRKMAVRRLQKFYDAEKKESVSDAQSQSSKSSAMKNVRLPKLELPTFSGNVVEWKSFWDQYKVTVHESDLPGVNKFTYLKSLLKGEAKSCIDGLSVTEGHYLTACQLLEERFGKPDRIIFAHIQGLLGLTLREKLPKLAALKALQDELLLRIRSLESLGVSGDGYGVFLTPLVLSRLPVDLRLEWARNCVDKERDVKYLLHVLKVEIERHERADTFQTKTDKVNQERKKVTGGSSAAALQTFTKTSRMCGLCGGAHQTQKCYEFVKLNIEDRTKQIKEARLCFKCFGPSHLARNCKDKCSGCGGRHHLLLCTEGLRQSRTTEDETFVPPLSPCAKPVQPDVAVQEIAQSMHCAATVKTSNTVLQTVKVQVQGPYRSVEATVMFDGGSDRTFISCPLVKKLGLKYVDSIELNYSVFGGGNSGNSVREIYAFQLRGLNVKDTSNISLSAVAVPTICATLSKPAIPDRYVEFLNASGVQLTTASGNGDLNVDILVGLDYYWHLVRDRIVRIPATDLVAQDTAVGWVLSGSLEKSDGGPARGAISSAVRLCVSEDAVRRFWELDSIGILPRETVEESPVLDKLNDSIKYKDGRYHVGLPWKDSSKLRDNRYQAQKRLDGLGKKLDRDPHLKQKYGEVFNELIEKGVVEKVDEDEVVPYPVFYLPHRPVVREESLTTKVRPVFDASARGPNGVSLNDCLHTGPKLIPDLVEVLVRFRRWNVAISADICKAFLQIGLHREDQDVHRFLLESEGSVQAFKFVRVTFGNKASPFLLNGAVKYHLSKYPPSRVIQELQQNLYVDDWLTGANTELEACQMFEEAVKVMKAAGLDLAKWNSNSKVLADKICVETGADISGNEGVKVLGISWNHRSDSFAFTGVPLPSTLVTTKRVVLSCLARIFDPLGFLNPYVMTAKYLFQQLWRDGLDWDDEVSEEIHAQFAQWIKGLEVVKAWEIPRCYSALAWGDFDKVELHSFGDASERGYGAVVYLRVQHLDGKYTASLVVSKSRVAPLKKVTLPRLELLGSLLAARLLNFVKRALALPENIRYYCWSDSTAALGWIKGDPFKWKPFVANRVSEIQNLTDPSLWFHCPGIDNPADLTTRGVTAEMLVASKLWLRGPSWLNGMPDEFSSHVCSVVCSQNDEGKDLVATDEGKDLVARGQVGTAVSKIFEVERWSKFTKACRVVAWVRRFIFNARNRNRPRSGEPTREELGQAKTDLFRQAQRLAFPSEIGLLKRGEKLPKGSPLVRLTPFVDDEGLLRVQGRLQLSELSYEEKHPVILPKDHTSKLLVRFHHLLLKHAGEALLLTSLRASVWIIGLRRLAKTVRRECFPCQRLEAKSCNQVGPPLPGTRVSQAPPFSVVGIDYAGPLFSLDTPGKKLYVCLFTCAVIRAVHLELADNLTSQDFVLAFRRFVSRRGLPSIVYSDNARTFKGSIQSLKSLYGPVCPEWKFIAPRSPWWGGWWERLVKSVKSPLKRSLGTSLCTRCELETCLVEVENCINSRPLTFVGDDVQSYNSLTPNHFLSCQGLKLDGQVHEDPEAVSLSLRQRICKEKTDRFWEIWRTEYLRNLPCSIPKFREKGVVKVGTVVLIREDNVPRLQWDLGVVSRVFPGKDNKVRAVELHTRKGSKVRSIQRLHIMEYIAHPPPVPSGGDSLPGLQGDEVPLEEAVVETDRVAQRSQSDRKTSSGRIVKPVNKLDL